MGINRQGRPDRTVTVQVTLATKDDLRKLTMWIAGMLIGQIAIMTAIISVLGN